MWRAGHHAGRGGAELVADAGTRLDVLDGKFRRKYAGPVGPVSFGQWRSRFSQPLRARLHDFLVHMEP